MEQDARDEENDSVGDYGDSNTNNQDDWTEDLGEASGLDMSPDQGLLSPPGPVTEESSSFAMVVTKTLGLSVALVEKKTSILTDVSDQLQRV